MDDLRGRRYEMTAPTRRIEYLPSREAGVIYDAYILPERIYTGRVINDIDEGFAFQCIYPHNDTSWYRNKPFRTCEEACAGLEVWLRKHGRID